MVNRLGLGFRSLLVQIFLTGQIRIWIYQKALFGDFFTFLVYHTFIIFNLIIIFIIEIVNKQKASPHDAESCSDSICLETYVFIDSSRYIFVSGFPHICHSIRTASAAKTVPNRAPPGMCSKKKTGSTNSLSQTDVRSMIIPMKGSIISKIRTLWLTSRKRTRIPMRIKMALIPKMWMWVNFRAKVNSSVL